MRHLIAHLLRLLVERLDHGHCPYCGTEDVMCCITTPGKFDGCGPCAVRVGRCWLCDGSGVEIANLERDGTLIVINCRECGGTGY